MAGLIVAAMMTILSAPSAVGVNKTQCSLDGQPFTSSCTSLVTYDKLSKGTHQFTVRATDAAAAGKGAIL